LEDNSTLQLARRLVDFQKFDYVAAWGEKKHHCRFTSKNWSLWKK
jgi:hypothetical protein